MVLLRCLSPQSHTVTRMQSDEYIGGNREQVVTVQGSKAADQAFDSLFRK